MKTNRDCALEYAARGWKVFPVYEIQEDGQCSCGGQENCTPGKHPRIKGGFSRATDRPEQIKEWWAQWPDANIGIRTGQASELVVLDVDPRSGGEVSLRALEQEIGQLPTTVTTHTGGGGLHLYFAAVRGSLRGRTGFQPGLDLKAEGGYVIAPPSLHESGDHYCWEEGRCPDGAPLAEIPDGLLQILSAHQDKGGKPSRLFDGSPIRDGSRDNTLTRIAGVFRAQGMEPEDYLPLLEEVNWERVQPPVTDADLERIARSVARYPAGREDKSDTPLEASDMGNARRLVNAHGGDLRYVFGWNKWIVWDGTCWREDDRGQVERLAKEVVGKIRKEALRCTNEDQRQELFKWAKTSQSKARIDALISLARSEPEVAIEPKELFCDPWRLPVKNGTIDLRTGGLLPHDRKDMVTQVLDIDYDPEAKAPEFKKFLGEVTAGHDELQEYIQRAVGYSLTGTVGERILFLLLGDGKNGKSTLLLTLLGLFGPFGTQAEPKLLVSSHWDPHPTGVADLQGKRLVVAVEANAGRSFDHALIKQLTGGDMVKARRMRQDFFEFEPTHHLWLAMNKVPEIDPDDQAMWDRLRVVPFTVRIEGEKEIRDFHHNLLKEKEGILAWAVEGCREWQEKGLGEPPTVVTASESVRQEMDPVGRFLDEECTLEPEVTVASTPLYEAFGAWCKEEGESAVNRSLFGRALTRRGVARIRDSSGRTVYQGIGFLKDLNHLKDSSTYPSRNEEKTKTNPNNGSDGSEVDDASE